MSEKLKPCPFCGGDAEMDSRRAYRNIDSGQHEMAVAVYCRSCAADISICIPDVPTITTDEVRTMWNARQAAEAQDVQAAIDDEKLNQWKAAIINELVVDCIYSTEHDNDPRKALGDAIEWNCKVALDSRVSKEARELQQQAIDAALRDLHGWISYLGIPSNEDHHFNRGASFVITCIQQAIDHRINSNPLADLQAQLDKATARVAELEDLYESMLDWRAKCDELTAQLAEARKDLSDRPDTTPTNPYISF